MQYAIREAQITDGAAISGIYAPFVESMPTSFEEVVPGAEEMSRRVAEMTATYPYLVAETGGNVIGYAYGTRHAARASYRWAVDVSVYIASGHHRRGIGRALYGILLPLLAEQGFFMVHAGITLPNAGSVGLHESIGFEPVGIYRNVGFKLGQWHDVGWWAKQLNAPRANPREPTAWSDMPRLKPAIVESAAG